MKQLIIKTIFILFVISFTGCSLSPKKIDNQSQYNNTHLTLKSIIEQQKNITGNITLEEAIARVLKYNLDNRLQQTQLALESGSLNQAYLEMLPSLLVDGNYSFRNNEQIQNLVQNGQVVPGEQSFTPREIVDFSAGVQWNILDFGLSYTRAQQQANRVMIMKEQQRKITQALIQQTIAIYWKAWTAQQMAPKVARFKKEAEKALLNSILASKNKLSPNEKELDYQNVLIKAIRKATKLQLQIADAKASLSRLMNANQNSQYQLIAPKESIKKLPNINPEFEKMDLLALLYRPELREASYQKQIAEKGVQAAVLEMLPGISFDYGYNNTNNQFMLNRNWLGGNINLSFDLINSLLKAPMNIKNAKMVVQYEQLKQAATTATVLTQIRIAYSNYLLWQSDYHYAKQEVETTEKLYLSALNNEKAKRSSKQETIRRALDALNSEFDEQITFANAYEALATIYQSIGLDFLDPSAKYLPLEQLTQSIGKILQAQSNGDFNNIIDQSYKQAIHSIKQLQKPKNTKAKIDSSNNKQQSKAN